MLIVNINKLKNVGKKGKKRTYVTQVGTRTFLINTTITTSAPQFDDSQLLSNYLFRHILKLTLILIRVITQKLMINANFFLSSNFLKCLKLKIFKIKT